jgi:hypothetical protein
MAKLDQLHGWRIRRLDSVSEALEAAKHPAKREENQRMWHALENGAFANDPMAWYGINGDLKQVRRLITEGWEEGSSKVLLLAEQAAAFNPPKPASIRRRRVFSDSGDSIDMGRVWAGQIDRAWTRCSRAVVATTKYIEIVVNIAVNCNIAAEVVFWRGAAALTLADMLVGAGYAVRITGANAVTEAWVTGKTRNSLQLITVKDYQNPLDISNLASVVCLGGFLRSVLYQEMTTFDADTERNLG